MLLRNLATPFICCKGSYGINAVRKALERTCTAMRLGARRASLCLVGKTLMHFRAGVHIRLQMPAHARRASAKKLRYPR